MRVRVAAPGWLALALTFSALLVPVGEAGSSTRGERASGSALARAGQGAAVAAAMGASTHASSGAATFFLISPKGFGVICGWFLACLYTATWSQQRSTIAAEHKPVVNLFLLATGPLGLVGFVIVQRSPTLRRRLDPWLSRVAGRMFSSPVELTDSVPLELCTSDGGPVGSGGGRHAPGTDALEAARRIIHEALERRASDILIDPRSGEVHQLRYRIDGLLHEMTRLPADQGTAVINCLKVASQLDISEKRRPQDGAFLAKLDDREIKFRSATAGTLYGEKIAVRIFDSQAGLMGLDYLGLNDAEANQLAQFMQRSDGMLLMAGPTGSGKTTTVYAALSLLAGQHRNIVTIEDPIEYPVAHASQTEVNPKANITFANGLRSMLRQDPDVILVGEIRDAETAGIALQASQTGHLVLSTIHSVDGPTALARLVEFGIEPFLVTTGLSIVLSQRLLRVLCPDCKRRARISPKLRREAARRQIAMAKVSVAIGCDRCDQTGYVGRTGIFEVLALTHAMGKLLTRKPSLATIRAQARVEKVVSMRQRGIEKVVQGLTTVEEVLRVTT